MATRRCKLAFCLIVLLVYITIKSMQVIIHVEITYLSNTQLRIQLHGLWSLDSSTY